MTFGVAPYSPSIVRMVRFIFVLLRSFIWGVILSLFCFAIAVLFFPEWLVVDSRGTLRKFMIFGLMQEPFGRLILGIAALLFSALIAAVDLRGNQKKSHKRSSKRSP